MTDLFQIATFKSHAGLDLDWKIECDALNTKEWECIAKMIMELTQPFQVAVGVPRGGIKLGKLLNEYATGDEKDPVCIVDDVLTTGGSMEVFYQKHLHVQSILGNKAFTAFGWVVFARNQPPNWVKALFQMPF